MSSRRILVAYDGSAASIKALNIAREIASVDPDITIILVHVVRIFTSGAAASGIDTVVLDEIDDVKAELNEIASTIHNNTEVKILKGVSPADLIVNSAKENDCDLIIMGSRGKGGVKGYLGSVSYAVTKNSPVTVMIAKEES